MAEPIRTLRTQVSGLWSPRHVIFEGDEQLGVLSVTRNGWGMVTAGMFRPEKGEVLHLRRDPGLLRAQFSIWTDEREWLGSSLRWATMKRQIDLWTGGKPYRLVPLPGLRRGWRMVATKTGEVARVEYGLLGRGAEIQLFRKTDFELLLFAYFLGAMVLSESMFPTSLDPVESGPQKAPEPSKA